MWKRNFLENGVRKVLLRWLRKSEDWVGNENERSLGYVGCRFIGYLLLIGVLVISVWC